MNIRMHLFESFKIINAGKIKWIREESLADIAAIEMIDLPLSDSEGAIEKQLKSDNGMLKMFNISFCVRIVQFQFTNFT